ncbi:MAG: DUF3854 domain-containing protein [Armatimonadota bacterium]
MPEHFTNTPKPDELLPIHKKLIVDSGIAEEVALQRGYRSIMKKSELRSLGFAESQCRVPALLLPIRSVLGEIVNYQIRPNQPRIRDGKAVKYETPAKSKLALDVPPSCLRHLSDPNVPLFITEGVRKADSAASRGICCIDLLGVWNWRGSNDVGGKVALPDWEMVALNDRQVYICFDSDVVLKPAVYKAMERIKPFLEQRGAKASVIYLPACEGGAKVGLDDFLASGNDLNDLLQLASNQLKPVIENNPIEQTHPYRSTPSGLIWSKETTEGSVLVPLTNFSAEIKAELVIDDGSESNRFFEIEGHLGDRTTIINIPSSRFDGMGWVTEFLGAKAVVYPGNSSRDRARAAIQLTSNDITQRIVFSHTGWREIDGVWHYLHAGGAIGPDGNNSLVEVRLPDSMSSFQLPEPPVGSDIGQAIKSSLRILDVAPDEIVFPLFCAIWASAVMIPDVSVFLTGATGTGKSELVALCQQHWGPKLDARHLPGSWTSTSNALESLAFHAKNALFVIDDFIYTGSSADAAKLNRDADRILRAQGNNSSRIRMRADSSIRPSKPPRCMILSTGEDVPSGQSLRARTLIVEITKDDIDWQFLTECQKDAASGEYAKALAGFVRWISPQYQDLSGGLSEMQRNLRDGIALTKSHMRAPDNVAKLLTGLKLFLDYAKDVSALSEEAACSLWERGLSALRKQALSQQQHQTEYEPASRFIELLRSAITRGDAFLSTADDATPADPESWGWQKVPNNNVGSTHYIPRGSKIGWVDETNLFLDPESALAVAKQFSQDMGEPFTINRKTLQKRLLEKGLLISCEESRNTLTVRRWLSNKRRSVLHMSVESIYPQGTDLTDQTDPEVIDHLPVQQTPGQVVGQSASSGMLKTDPVNRPLSVPTSSDFNAEGGEVSVVSARDQAIDTDWGLPL